MRRALITGITGQDGSYLAELLLSKGYEIHGLVRRSSSATTARIDRIRSDLKLHEGDLQDASSLARVVAVARPDEVYNLGAQTHVHTSFDAPVYTGDASGLGAARLLEAVRLSERPIRWYQASTSEMFGNCPPPQNEATPLHPRSPYGAAKLYAYWMTVNAREAYGLHASNGILFNHESQRRGEQFVSRKITRAAARIKLGLQKELALGNLEARRDWGHAADYVQAMWLMLQKDTPGDYVIASGTTHSIREFLDEAFGYLDLDWKSYVRQDPVFHRPAEVNVLCGDASKAKRELGWEPQISFKQLVRMMIDADMELTERKAT